MSSDTLLALDMSSHGQTEISLSTLIGITFREHIGITFVNLELMKLTVGDLLMIMGA